MDRNWMELMMIVKDLQLLSLMLCCCCNDSSRSVYLLQTMERTKKMMEGKISDAKKKELQEKINVLRSFTKQDDSKAKEEL